LLQRNDKPTTFQRLDSREALFLDHLHRFHGISFEIISNVIARSGSEVFSLEINRLLTGQSSAANIFATDSS
jgi:hypothetical protein